MRRRGTVGDELNRLEQSLAAHVADHGMLRREPLKMKCQAFALGADVRENVILEDRFQDGDRRRAGERVALERVTFDKTPDWFRSDPRRRRRCVVGKSCADTGATPPPKPFATHNTSGVTPKVSAANRFPCGRCP